jgi:hypothetical protein
MAQVTSSQSRAWLYQKKPLKGTHVLPNTQTEPSLAVCFFLWTGAHSLLARERQSQVSRGAGGDERDKAELESPRRRRASQREGKRRPAPARLAGRELRTSRRAPWRRRRCAGQVHVVGHGRAPVTCRAGRWRVPVSDRARAPGPGALAPLPISFGSRRRDGHPLDGVAGYDDLWELAGVSLVNSSWRWCCV